MQRARGSGLTSPASLENPCRDAKRVKIGSSVALSTAPTRALVSKLRAASAQARKCSPRSVSRGCPVVGDLSRAASTELYAATAAVFASSDEYIALLAEDDITRAAGGTASDERESAAAAAGF